MSRILGLTLIATALLSACEGKIAQPDPITPAVVDTLPAVHAGPFWAAFMIYSDQYNEVRYGIGPFISEGACRERLIAELLQIKDDGGTPSFGECVPSDELGAPLEAIVIPQGRGI